jgi:hypothetical protein
MSLKSRTRSYGILPKLNFFLNANIASLLQGMNTPVYEARMSYIVKYPSICATNKQLFMCNSLLECGEFIRLPQTEPQGQLTLLHLNVPYK